MAVVTASRIPEISGFTGLDLDVTDAEIAICNIPGMLLFPYIDAAKGYVAGASPTTIWDRLNRVTLPNAGAVNTGIGALAEGTPALIIGSQNSVRRDAAASLADGFTFFAVANDKMAISSNTSSGTVGYWCHGDSTVSGGAITMRIGGYTSVVGDYTGPALDTSHDRVICFRYDPVAGNLLLRVDGEDEVSYTDPSIAGIVPHPQFQFGLKNNAGSLTSAYKPHGGCLAYSRPLTSEEIATVEAYLTGLKA